MKIQHAIVFLVAVFYGVSLSAIDAQEASVAEYAGILGAADSTEIQRIDAVNGLCTIAKSHFFLAGECITLLKTVYDSFNDVGRREVFEALSMIAIVQPSCALECTEFIISKLSMVNQSNYRAVVEALAAIGRVHLSRKEQIKESILGFLNARYENELPEYGKIALQTIDDAHRMRHEFSVSHVSHGESYGFSLCMHGWTAVGHLYPV